MTKHISLEVPLPPIYKNCARLKKLAKWNVKLDAQSDCWNTNRAITLNCHTQSFLRIKVLHKQSALEFIACYSWAIRDYQGTKDVAKCVPKWALHWVWDFQSTPQNFLIFDIARWPMWNLQLTAIKFPVAAQAESLRLASPRAIASAIISARQMYNLSLAHYSHRRL